MDRYFKLLSFTLISNEICRSLLSTISEEKSETFIKKIASTKFYRFSSSFLLFFLFFLCSFPPSRSRVNVFLFYTRAIHQRKIDRRPLKLFVLRGGKRRRGWRRGKRRPFLVTRANQYALSLYSIARRFEQHSRQRQILLNCSFLLVHGECKAWYTDRRWIWRDPELNCVT